MTPAARLSGAIDLLCAIQNAPRRPADATANNFFRERRYIGGGDRRAISDLVWNVLRSWRRLHWHLHALMQERKSDVSPRLLCASMLYFSGHDLEEVKTLFSHARYAPSPLTIREETMLEGLLSSAPDTLLGQAKQPQAVRLEIPDWLMPRLKETFGDQLDAEMEALLGSPTLDLRVNLLKATRKEAQTLLRREGFESILTALSPWCLRLKGRQAVTSSQVFRDGIVEIQDEGSQLVAATVNARPGQRLLDYCAGAGGKTLALAMTMENRGQITACDVSRARLEGAVKRFRRAGVHNVTRHLLEEGDKWAKRRAGHFDRVLVDAPCSGTGTWRRNPDARLRLSGRDIEELLPKQAAILRIAARLVRPGGLLVYATCSLLKDENRDQIESFLAEHSDYALAGAEHRSPFLPEILRQEACFSLTPRQQETDGFFIAVMKRQEIS